MAEIMTIYDAVDAFELYELYDEILEAYEPDFYTRAELDVDLRDLIEAHEETYEFTPDEDGAFAESMERNLKEALAFIFDAHGVEHRIDDDFMDEAMDDDEIAGIYDSGLDERQMAGRDEADGLDDDNELF